MRGFCDRRHVPQLPLVDAGASAGAAGCNHGLILGFIVWNVIMHNTRRRSPPPPADAGASARATRWG